MANGVKTYAAPIALIVDAQSYEDAAQVQSAVADLVRHFIRQGKEGQAQGPLPVKAMADVARVKRVNVEPFEASS